MLINGANIVGSENAQAQAQEFIIIEDLTATTGTTVGAVLKLQNVYDCDILITDVAVRITTAADNANTIDMGVDDGGDVGSDLLLDGLAMNATGVFDNRIDKGSNGGMAVWKDGEYIVATASATLVGLVGKVVIKGIAI